LASALSPYASVFWRRSESTAFERAPANGWHFRQYIARGRRRVSSPARRTVAAYPQVRIPAAGNTDHITHRQQLPIFSTSSSVLPLRAAEHVSHPMPRRVLDNVCCPTAAIGALTAYTFKRVISLISPYSIIIRVEQRWRDTPIPRPLTFLSTSSGAAVVAGLADSAVSR